MESIVSKQLIGLALWALLSASFNHTAFQQSAPTQAQTQAQTSQTKPAHIHNESGPPASTNDNHRGRDNWQRPDDVLKAMEVQPGQVIVDIGAGSGYFTRRFAAAVGPKGKALGIEIDSAMVRKMTADAQTLGLTNYEARLVSARGPMLASGSADVIFLCDAYHHINDRPAYFARVKPALRPGGRLVIIDYVKTEGHNDSHASRREDVISELEQAGYRLTKEFDLLLPKQLFLIFEPGAKTTTGVIQ